MVFFQYCRLHTHIHRIITNGSTIGLIYRQPSFPQTLKFSHILSVIIGMLALISCIFIIFYNCNSFSKRTIKILISNQYFKPLKKAWGNTSFHLNIRSKIMD